jgi:spore maturation protein CgeB
MKVLCAFGKYQYGDSSRGISTEYAAFVPALKRLGHEVVHFETWDHSLYSSYAELNRMLLEAIDREAPDVLLAVQLNYEIWLETLRLIKTRGHVATICWMTDDSWKYREVSRFIGNAYHAVTTTYPDVVPQYFRDGIPNVMLTQWAANSETLKEPLAALDCQYRVSFVGTAHGDRKQRIEELCANGIDVSCFGYGWPAGPVSSDDIPRIMRQSIISLNYANSRGQNQIKARTFEVPGAGGFLLTEYAPGLGKFYDTGKEIDVFYQTEELVDKIKYYLSHLEERDSKAKAGFVRTCREHTYETRMKTVLDYALCSRDKWLKNHRNQSGLSLERAVQKHKINPLFKFLRKMLIVPCVLIWGNIRGRRAARRLTFELSWRLFGEKTFTASGWPGRMFPEQ